MANEVIQARIQRHLKQEAERLFASMGLSLSEAIRLFLQQSVNEGGLPFRPRAKRAPQHEPEVLNRDPVTYEVLYSETQSAQDW